MFLALSLFSLLSAIVVNAQTQAQIQACANSIQLTSYEAEPTWSTQDSTHHFNATYTYSPSDCLTPKEVPITRIYLANLNGPTYNCPKPPFDSTGVLYTECSQSLGTIAQAAKDGDADWGIIMTLGIRPTLYTIENDFTVNYVDPPQPSGAVARRRRALLGLQKKCLPGYSFCPVGKGLSECIDTSTNLYACGGCAMDPQTEDCSAIQGADQVECKWSRCFVKTCTRGYTVSPDRKSCIAVGI